MISHSKKNYNRRNIATGVGNRIPEVVEPTPLKDVPIPTKLYTAQDVDKIISQLTIIGKDGIIIPDQEITGDYYCISMRSGRLTIVKVDGPNS